MTDVTTGRCFCKKIRFEITHPIQACVNCHCESCRRQCSAPMTTYVGVQDAQWRWLGDAPKIFNSSPGVTRTFCDTCGTPLSFRSDRMSDVMHFYLAALDDPELFQPDLHVAIEEKLDWLAIDESLPGKIGPDYTKD